ncbi:homeobox-like domain superfamily [Holotrichia oblita]|nr:homeobox-like domain superfamily [Holotrichia oblita]
MWSYDKEQEHLNRLWNEVDNENSIDDPPIIDSQDEHFSNHEAESSHETDTEQSGNEVEEESDEEDHDNECATFYVSKDNSTKWAKTNRTAYYFMVYEDFLLEGKMEPDGTKPLISQLECDHIILWMENKKILRYSEADMQQALAAVRSGMAVSTSSRTYKVPRTTLLYKHTGKYPIKRKMGPDTVFSEKEKAFVRWIHHIAKAGFPATKNQLLDSVQLLLKKTKKTNPFVNSRPGRH